MFAENRRNKTTTESFNQQNTIAKGTIITGDIVSETDFRIEGTVKGNIKTPGKIVLGKTGVINGTLKAANADIEGKFSGKLILSDTLSLRASAFLEGEVEVGKFSVEPGATFNATCVMKSTLKELSINNVIKDQPANETQKRQLA